MTPEQRVLRAKIAAYTLHAKRDSKQIAANARDGIWKKYLSIVDPNGELPESEQRIRGMRMHYAELARQRLKKLRTAA